MTVTCLPATTTASNSRANGTPAAAAAAASASSDPSTAPQNPRMGRRKQHCPQKTGIGGSDAAGGPQIGDDSQEKDNNNVSGQGTDDKAESESISSSSDKEVTMPTLESLEPASSSQANKAGTNGVQESSPAKDVPTEAKAAFGGEEALSSMLKNPLLNPALFSLNPSLYAVQLAQLQAALSQSAGLQQLAAAAGNSADLMAPKRPEEAVASSLDATAAALSGFRKRKLAEEEEAVLNLSKKSQLSSPNLIDRLRAESPLDLSGQQRKSGLLAAAAAAAAGSPPKSAKMDGMGPWTGSAFPLFNPFLSQDAMTRFPAAAAAAAAASSVRSPPSNAATGSGSNANPLERMSEIAKTGGNTGSQRGQRHSAWQSQWINRGPEATKEIFKCVWCKDSFSTLQGLTTHMKETKHFGASIPASPQLPSSSPLRPPSHSPQAATQVKPPQVTPPPPPPPAPTTPTSSSAAAAAAQNKRDILKEQLPLPRKLVRGQDVWLGRGEQQTKDILKCMWCGESFRSLDIMTKHMQETKHYTKVISQEQLVSWKSTEPPTSGSSGGAPQNHVNAVLTCKVCEQPFASLKDLSEHMVKNNHYKENEGPPGQEGSSPIPPPSINSLVAAAAASARPPPPSSTSSPSMPGSSSGAAKEKRKKSLPVRKLLELERAQQELTGQLKTQHETNDSAGKISCEKCGEKILMHLFVDHIRQCVGPLPISRPSPVESRSSSIQARTPSVSPPKSQAEVPVPIAKSSAGKEEPKSILGSLEKMVQSNFGTKKKSGGPEGNMSILQRLGIDEGVDYSKPLVDPMAMFRQAGITAAMTPAAMAAAISASGLAGLFPNHPGAAGLMAMNETRSNSECSSPDRLRSLERPNSVKSGASSPNGSNVGPKSPEAEKSKKEEEERPMNVDGEEDDQFSEDAERSSVLEEKEDRKTPNSQHSSSNKINVVTNSRPSSTGSGSAVSPRAKTPASPKSSADDEQLQQQQQQTRGEKKEKKKGGNPLAALQMLCDQTEKTPKPPPATTASSVYGTPTDPGAILAFSWACNQAVVNDSLLKCPFCDTPFISKGAYRHHLSKMHFVKDGASPDPKLFMPGGGRTPEKCPTPTSNNSSSDGNGAKEENAQSKFAKYSQLAKQLSCSSQP